VSRVHAIKRIMQNKPEVNVRGHRRKFTPFILKLRNGYFSQQYSAARRGIEFLLSFEEWLDIWRSSGKLSKRGRGKGKYCMARLGDRGPYKVGNVEIILDEKNKSDWQKHPKAKANLRRLIEIAANPSPETRRKISLAGRGRPKSTAWRKMMSQRMRGRPGLKGADNHNAKLTNEQARQIRAVYAAENISYQELGQLFGVCRSTIGNIITGTNYAAT
jgi:hypothetical protein